MRFVFLFSCCLIEFFSFGQKEKANIVGKCNCEKVASIDPDAFTIDTVVLNRERPKNIQRPLKLGIQKGCLFVIDSIGNIQPYVVREFQLSTSVSGGTSSQHYKTNCIKCYGNRGVMSMICCLGLGFRFFIDNIVVEDSAGKEKKGLVEPLTMMKMK